MHGQKIFSQRCLAGNDKESVRNVVVAKVLPLPKQVAEESANNDDWPHALNSSSIRLFDAPTLNLEANAYYGLTYREIEECLKKPLVLHTTHVISNLWSGMSNLLRKSLHKLQDLLHEMESFAKKINLANL